MREKLKVPGIGIGSGPYTDAQTLALHDLTGLFNCYIPKFVKLCANVVEVVLKASSAIQEEGQRRLSPRTRI